MKRYVYVWADGVYFSPRLEHERQCILVLIGADESGSEIGPWLRGSHVSQSNELSAIDDGFRESEQSWHELLVRLRDENGLSIEPELATGDGSLGFLESHQEDLANHQAATLLGAQDGQCSELSAEVGSEKGKSDLHQIYNAVSRTGADEAFDRFVAKYGAKYQKASACLTKDRDTLPAFYDFPAEHRQHVRSTNPIESTFATVRLGHFA